MAEIASTAASVYRDFVVAGVASSGEHDPVKAEIRALWTLADTAIAQAADVAITGVRWVTQTIRTRSTANVNLASGLVNGATLNGEVLATGDHVFVGSQTAPAENGIYTVVAAGAASRATFADSSAELAHIGFMVATGAVGAGERWTLPLAADAITVGSTALAFAKIGAAFDLGGIGVNTWVGTDALADNVAGIQNVAIGDEALRDTLANGNTAIGSAALRGNTNGLRNTAVGLAAGRAITEGDDNVYIGSAAGLSRTTGDQNVLVGANVMNAMTGGGDANTHVGYAAVPFSTGFENATLGAFTGSAMTTAARNVCVGAYAGAGIATGLYNIAIGYAAGVSNGAVSNSIAIGLNLLASQSNAVYLGGGDIDEYLLFGGVSFFKASEVNSSYYLGPGGNKNSTRQASLSFGKNALMQTASGGHCIAIGHEAMSLATDAGSVVAVGSYAGQAAGTTGPLRDCVFVGFDAGRAVGSGVGATAVGHFALQNATEAGNNTAIGDSALRYTTTGNQNVAVGYVVMDRNTTGSMNVSVGQGAACYRQTGDKNVHVGHSSNFGPSADNFTGGDRNVGVGWQSLLSHTGDDVVAIGNEAGHKVTTGDQSVFIGSRAGYNVLQRVNVINSIVIGYGAYSTADNQVVIGNPTNDNFTFGATSFSAADLVALKALI